jgi:two-component system, cell cycle response regulator
MRVLIADDSAAARAVLERALIGLGHECQVASDGDAAWELFRRHPAEVVISDWMMPGLDGDELCRRVRDHSENTYPYFILLTSLEDHGHVLQGMQAGADDYLKKPFHLDDLKARLIAAARVTELHERLSAQQAELEQLNESLFRQSRTDPLTGVGNRIALAEQLAQLIKQAERHGHTYSVALFDVDFFKSYNDTCGHLAGDDVLRRIAAALAEACRGRDVVYRYGGEEMLVLLPDQPLEKAAVAAERLRRGIQMLAIPHAARGEGGVVTASAGVAQLEGSDGEEFDAILRRADEALYRAKELGRNRIELGAFEPAR